MAKQTAPAALSVTARTAKTATPVRKGPDMSYQQGFAPGA